MHFAKYIVTGMLGLMFVGDGTAQIQRHSLSLSVQQISTTPSAATGFRPNEPRRHRSKDSSGQDVVTKNQSISLEIRIRNSGGTPDEAIVQYYFLAASATGGDTTIFDSGEKKVTIDPAGESKFTVESAPISSSVTNVKTYVSYTDGTYDYKWSRQKSGKRPKGWLVRVVRNGQIIITRGSNFEYEAASKDPDRWQRMGVKQQP